jgi:membrane associated rhomboid family serine protease
MAKKNGHDDEEDPKIAHFPDPRERREVEHRLRVANDRAAPSEPILNLPPAIKWLCLVLILAYIPIGLLQFLSDEHHPHPLYVWVLENFSFTAARYNGDMPFGWQGVVTPFSYMLLHGSPLHLGLNIAMLAAFGAGLERDTGGKKLLIIFLVTGVIAAFSQASIYLLCAAAGHADWFPDGEAPLIGASGGISGVVGAVIVMAKDRGLLADMLNGRITKPVIAIIASILLLGMFGVPGAGGPIAWIAHLGGFFAGLLLYRPVARLKIK